MSAPRYAPPAENAKIPVSSLDREIMKWDKIHTFTGIPIQTSPITVPVILGFYLLGSAAARFNVRIVIGIGILLFGTWIFAGSRLGKLKQEKFKKQGDWEIPE